MFTAKHPRMQPAYHRVPKPFLATPNFQLHKESYANMKVCAFVTIKFSFLL